jgi:HEAT repeat protein
MTRTPAAMFNRARAHLRSEALRRGLQETAAGKRKSLALDLNDAGVDVAGLVVEATATMDPEGPELAQVIAALHKSGSLDAVIDGLGAREPHKRAGSARIVGTLGIEQAVAWLGPLLASREPAIRHAAARALGSIGGARSADLLLLSMQRNGPRTSLILALARAAPDLYVEVALCSPARPAVRSALAICAGLRRRQTAVAPLLEMLARGTRRERVASCRALTSIASHSAAPLIAEALTDRDWKVRIAAARALVVLKANHHREAVAVLLLDRNLRVQMAGKRAMKHLVAR